MPSASVPIASVTVKAPRVQFLDRAGDAGRHHHLVHHAGALLDRAEHVAAGHRGAGLERRRERPLRRRVERRRGGARADEVAELLGDAPERSADAVEHAAEQAGAEGHRERSALGLDRLADA